MPGKIKVKVLAGRNLPVMDRASDTTDAFVEIKFGGVTHKTDVCRKSLNPHWNNTEWYRFEVDESELQDEPLQLRLMDHDTYSANDAIGKVVISLAPLLAREANNVKGTAGPPGGAVMSGWIPVFDTMHGIRGELNVIVKVELFSDFNKYKTSSCGVQFFHCPSIPPGYRATSVHGFVEELVVNDDPEYQWIDKIRTPRASNEARQVAFIKLSNQVQRLVGLKAAELGANAVVGYQQEFDLEGEAGVVARAIGTAISITPLPTPSQPMNIPPCTQQQLKKCLDILATGNESITDLSQYYQTHQEELQKMISILNPKDPSMLDEPDVADDDDEKVEQGGRLSIHSFTGSMSLFQDDYVSHRSLRHLSEDQTDLNKLLNRKDDDDDSDSSDGPIQKIKKLKTNFFTKRFSKRKRDKKEKQDDQISIKSNSSDASRISFNEIKNELKKRLKKPKIRKVFTNPDDEGVGMASILARSVIHAHTSLACIAETQDSEHSTQETMRRTSESEPNVNVSDDEKSRKISMNKVQDIKNEMEGNSVPEIHFSSLKNMSSDEAVPVRVRKTSESCPTSPVTERSENLLKLPGDKGYFDSVSSALSGESSETYTSSEEDDESSDGKSDSDETVETTTSVVNSVLNHEVNPAFIAQMEQKLCNLENVHPPTSEIVHVDLQEVEKETSKPLEVQTKESETKFLEGETKTDESSKLPEVQTSESETKFLEVETKTVESSKPQEKVELSEPSTSTQDPDKCVSKQNMHHIKIHNPFAHKKPSKSFSAPSSPVEKSSFVYRSSKRIKYQLAKLSKSNMIKSISHYSLLPKKKEDGKNLSQAGSSSNVPSRAPSDTVLGSLFLSYSDLLILDKEALQASSKGGICKSDEFGRPKVSMYIGSEPVSRTSLSGPSLPYHPKDEHDHYSHRKPSLKPTGLIHTAMETILMDKVDTILLPTSPDPLTKNNKQFFDDVSEKLEEHKNRGSPDLGIMKMGQVQSSTGSTTPRIVAMTPKRLSNDFTSHFKAHDKRTFGAESKGMVHTAMETMLMDKANVILPESPESTYQTKGPFHDDVHDKSKHKDHKDFLSSLKDKAHLNLDHVFGKHHTKNENSSDMKSGGLVLTAMQTMLMDRAQSMIPDTPEPIPIRTELVFDRVSRSRKASETQESSGMVHSAMQTMLIDKVQSVLPKTSEPIPIHLDTKLEKETEISPEESSGLVHSAMQTILMDKVQAVLPYTSDPIPIHLDNSDTQSVKDTETHTPDSSGLIQSAMQTILMDKVQAILPDTNEPIPIHLDGNDNKSEKGTESQTEESSGLIHIPMKTMLIENFQTVLPDTHEQVPIHVKSLDSDKSADSLSELQESSKIVQSAKQTILIDDVQSVLPDTREHVPLHLDDDTNSFNTSDLNEDIKSEGLLHSAVTTILFDKVQSLLNPETEIVAEVKQPNEPRSDKIIQTHSPRKDDAPKGLVHTAMETILIDRAQTIYPNSTDPDLITDLPAEEFKGKSIDNKSLGKHDEAGLVQTAMQTILMDKEQSIIGTPDNHLEIKPLVTEDLKSPGLVGTAMQTILMDKVKSVLPTTNAESSHLESLNVSKDIRDQDSHEDKTKEVSKSKKLIRQDSIHSKQDAKESHKMSSEDLSNMSPSKITRTLVLQHFHPILSGLETIPSMSESSFERSLDCESAFETNSASVCDNSHAACGFDRSERDRDRSEKDRGSPRHARHESYGGKDPVGSAQAQASLNSTSTPMGIHRRSSDSDLSVTPKGGSLNTSAGNVGSGGGAILRPSMNTDNLDMLEYPFLTMTEYPPGFIVHIGGTVCARSVKLVDGGGESAVRAAWWAELRTELRAHARALRCNAVIAYTDTCSICEDVCVLSASGTAAVINLDCDYNVDNDAPITGTNGNKNSPEESELELCSVAHVPYSPGAGPYRAELSTCGGCRRARVPAVLLATCAKPSRLMSYTKAVTLTAVAARVRRAQPSAEPGARDISDQLPFLEYELHKLLLAKLRMQGANALFSLQTQIAIGERCVMALASGTAIKLAALPPPTPPRIKATENDKDALDIQKKLWDSFTANKAANGFDIAGLEHTTNGVLPEVDREDPPILDLCADKDACVLELDEAEDVETARMLCSRRVLPPAFTPALRASPHRPPYAFAQVSRGRLSLSQLGGAARAAAERHVARALDSVAYKLRRLHPTALSTSFHLELPEDEIQLVVFGTAIPLLDPSKSDTNGSENGHVASQGNSVVSGHNGAGAGAGAGECDDDIFTLDEEQLVRSAPQEIVEDKGNLTGQVPTAVSLTSLSHITGVKVARRVCALRLLFVRETTAVRELGGLSGFLHTFTCEVLAIARAYTAALGGNALTSFYIRQLMLQDNAHKNQGQCLLSVGGDIVHITY